MTIETATYIASLVQTYPDGGDQRSTADDHIRLIKAAVKRSFPNVAAEVSASASVWNRLNYRSVLSYQLPTSGTMANLLGAGNYVICDVSGGWYTDTTENITFIPSTCIFTATYAGTYLLEFNAVLSLSTTNEWDLWLYDSSGGATTGVAWRCHTTPATGANRHQYLVSRLITFTAGQSFAIRAEGTSGDVLSMHSGSITLYRMV